MLKQKAAEFITKMYQELNYSSETINQRIKEINNEIDRTNTYTHTNEELSYGAKLAWRNSNRCVGRLFWESLQINDARDITSEEEFIQSINHHLKAATNEGRIVPYITIYSANHPPKIYNNQLIRYAGYEHKGDPSEKEVTRIAQRLGWEGQDTDFDILPLIYQLPGDDIKYYNLPKNLVKEIDIEHRNYPKLKELQLKWYAVPIISNMDLKIGGITYPTAPFNGWYMVTEIAVRNFLDTYRYNLLEKVAEAFNFDTLKNNSFNKDRVLVELSDAVYHSKIKVFLLSII